MGIQLCQVYSFHQSRCFAAGLVNNNNNSLSFGLVIQGPIVGKLRTKVVWAAEHSLYYKSVSIISVQLNLTLSPVPPPNPPYRQTMMSVAEGPTHTHTHTHTHMRRAPTGLIFKILRPQCTTPEAALRTILLPLELPWLGLAAHRQESIADCVLHGVSLRRTLLSLKPMTRVESAT